MATRHGEILEDITRSEADKRVLATVKMLGGAVTGGAFATALLTYADLQAQNIQAGPGLPEAARLAITYLLDATTIVVGAFSVVNVVEGYLTVRNYLSDPFEFVRERCNKNLIE